MKIDEQLKEMMTDQALDQQIEAFRGLARTLHAYYDALLEAGFTEEQAFGITTEYHHQFWFEVLGNQFRRANE